jgi:hypothetical protein
VSEGELNMAEKIAKLQSVSAAEVDKLIKQFELDSPAKITKTANGDGTFDLEIIFSDAWERSRK